MRTDVAALAALLVASCSAPPPRVATTDAAITAVAGHAIEIRADGDANLARAARLVRVDLERLKRDHPVVFERQVPRLARIERRFGDNAAAWEGNTFVITSRYRWDLLGEGELAGDLTADFYASLARRFATATPEAVAPSDQADYFRYVTHDRRDEPLPSEAAIEVVLRLAPHVVEPRLAADVRAWLFARAHDVADQVRDEGKTPEGKRARAAWTAWLGSVLPSATAAEKLVVAQAVYAVSPVYGNDYHEVDNAIDGFDAFAFGLDVADTWASSGHPTAPDGPSFALFDFVLAPPSSGRDGHLMRPDGRPSPWATRATATDAGLRRLDDALAARNDAALTAVVVYDLLGGRKRSTLASFLRDLERSPEAWRTAMLTLIREERRDGCGGLVDEANRAWRDVPSVRGTALHVIACKEARWGGSSDAFYVQFAHLYGQPIDAKVFGAFLADGTDAMKLAPGTWPALGKGWSRVDAIAPHLDAFLHDPDVRAGSDGEPMHTLLAIGKRLCDDGATGERARFRQALVTRAHADADTQRALAKVIDDLQPARCRR